MFQALKQMFHPPPPSHSNAALHVDYADFAPARLRDATDEMEAIPADDGDEIADQAERMLRRLQEVRHER